jgi:hypothetical protein
MIPLVFEFIQCYYWGMMFSTKKQKGKKLSSEGMSLMLSSAAF